MASSSREMSAGGAAPSGRPVRVPIPGGIWIDNAQPIRELLLRPVGEEDQTFLVDSAEALGPAQRASALLARCLVTESATSGDPPILVGQLTIGNREAALLQLRKLSLGGRVECVVTCPAADCGERLEIELAVDDLLVEPDPAPRREYRLQTHVAGEPHDVRFRLPTSADLDAASEQSQVDAESGARELLQRCVLGITHLGRAVPVEQLDDAARGVISAAMAERDPQAEIELELSCPSCGETFGVLFDTGTYLLQELDARAAGLLEDVHALALHYHWSESEILALPQGRRERYLELLADSLEGASRFGAS